MVVQPSNENHVGSQVVCPPAEMPKKSDMHDKMGMDPHDAKNFDSSSTYGKGGPGDTDMKKGDTKKEIPAPPPCYTVQVSATRACDHVSFLPP